ncbi:Cytochrome b5 reductase 4 [Escovopsis weberi]|uniref:Cytochrome b5 reductase 4 n=1 Tax=Escovopsis weberi TaxID=150374 RepID=A0A0M8N295_ESCWE|nr:Cytochrome b5 reductase 4 [Escovopsis weberi]
MALIGLSIILASVVYVVVRPPQWQWLHTWPIFKHILATTTPTIADPSSSPGRARGLSKSDSHDEKQQQQQQKDKPSPSPASAPQSSRPAAPPPLMVLSPPTIAEPGQEFQDEEEEATTPTAPSAPPPVMAPPPRPARAPVAQFPAANSPQRARGPLPNRSPFAPSSSSSSSSLMPGAGAGAALAPPPTHSSKPDKPSRKVVLTPGHSPLDWARISGPNCDLRGVPAATPYLRVTPSMLRSKTGRKGKDAWMALSGRVYNVTPYAEFHPGGVPELMRGAGRDATKLFGEIHPWVNYETMLSACLVGLLVDEPEVDQESEMDKMD